MEICDVAAVGSDYGQDLKSVCLIELKHEQAVYSTEQRIPVYFNRKSEPFKKTGIAIKINGAIHYSLPVLLRSNVFSSLV